jgi:adenylosuccinate synthase
MISIVCDISLGDTGKGKLADYLFSYYDYDAGASATGSSNRGHTVWANGVKYKFHLIPSSILSDKPSIIGNGVAINPEKFLEEIQMLKDGGFDVSKVFISNNCFLTLPLHKELDVWQEGEDPRIGSTKQGVGPVFSHKIGRYGVRVSSFNNERDMKQLDQMYKMLPAYFEPKMSVEDTFQYLLDVREQLAPYATDTVRKLNRMLDDDKNILIEGAQGMQLSNEHGVYPYVTSTDMSPESCCVGLGVSSSHINKVYGVMKSYLTYVGSGPFPTEVSGTEDGEKLVELGGEFGTTTGRKRRVGWLDIPALKYYLKIVRPSHLCMTKIDILDELGKFPVCKEYRKDGERVKFIPDPDYLAVVEPRIKEYNGEDFVDVIEDALDQNIDFLGTGPDRDDLLER